MCTASSERGRQDICSLCATMQRTHRGCSSALLGMAWRQPTFDVHSSMCAWCPAAHACDSQGSLIHMPDSKHERSAPPPQAAAAPAVAAAADLARLRPLQMGGRMALFPRYKAMAAMGCACRSGGPCLLGLPAHMPNLTSSATQMHFAHPARGLCAWRRVLLISAEQHSTPLLHT